jgi:AcrR family transcriptional regulator
VSPETAAPAPRRPHTVTSLLEVAVRVFNDRGYDGTSMEDLARAAGITKSSIYHHVRSKEALLGLALDEALGSLFGVLDEPTSTEGPARDRLEHVLRRSVEVLAAELANVTLLLRVRGNTPTELAALERRREFDHRVSRLVERAIADGDVRDDLDPSLVTRLLFGTVNSLVEWYDPDGELAVDEVADALVALLFDGLTGRGREQPAPR